MPQATLTIQHPAGLHARPASLFVQAANRFNCEVVVTYKDRSVNAKSILGILTLGANQGARIVISTEGDDAEGALAALKKLVERNFSIEDMG